MNKKKKVVFPGNAIFIKYFVYLIIINIYKVSLEVYYIITRNRLLSEK